MRSESIHHSAPKVDVGKIEELAKIVPADEQVVPYPIVRTETALPTTGNVSLWLQHRLKRLLDIAGSLFGMVVLSPIFITITMAIKFDSKGPAIFKQERIGKDSKPFTMYKFRSMRQDNDDAVHREYVTSLIRGESLDDLKGDGGSYKLEKDNRITKVGSFLRRTSVDEFPQLLNVFKGEMSLVGPRPPLRYEVDEYTPLHRQRLEATPGMTGLWQVSGRTETNFDEMVELDLHYINNWSLHLDLKILWRTIFTVLDRKGAW
jgi:lipopolysaccharide/colanic/teichoic acid biosynthesis glycosyltransferase